MSRFSDLFSSKPEAPAPAPKAAAPAPKPAAPAPKAAPVPKAVTKVEKGEE